MASVIADMVEWLKRWFYTEDEVDTLLSSKQARLVSGSNIKTINNESLLGSGNIEIESGDSGGLVNVEDYYFDEESENLVLDTDDEPFITTSWGDPTSDSLTPSEKLVKDSLDAKQDTLISGTTLKTINSETLLGSGNIEIMGSGDIVTSWSSTTSNSKVPSEKLTKNTLDLKFENIPVTPTSATDIDDFKDFGFYTFFNNSAVASMTEENKAKLPNGLGDNSFYLLVEKKLNYVKQTLTKYSDGRTWIRIYNDGVNVQSWSAWKELVNDTDSRLTDDRNFIVTNVIPSSTDDPKKNLDDYLTQGFYTFFANADIQYMEMSNFPTGLGQSSFYLLVERKSNSYVKQTLTKFNDGRTWIRAKNSSVWSDWKELSMVGHTHSTSDLTDNSTLVKKSSTSGLIKNDGSIDTSTYLTSADISGKLDKSIEIPSDSDLNDYVDTGFFYCTLNATATTIDNKPIDTTAFFLLVENMGNSNRIKQTFTTYLPSSNQTWIRTMYNDNWGNWKLVSQDGHTHSKTDITDFPSIPSKTSDLTNDGSDGTNVYVANNKITPTIETDINTYKTVGLYTFFNDSAVASMTEENKAKLPSGLGNNSFYLLVENKDGYAKQTLTKYSDGKTWIRIYNNNNNVQSWSDWKELSTVGHTHDDRYYTESEMDTALNGKQATLVSGTNIKTINNESLLGSGNITIQGGSNVDIVTSWESTLSDSKVASEKLVKNTLDTKINDSILLEPTQEDPIDLNDFTETGFYYQMDNTASAYVSHMPTEDNRAFSLLVEKQTGVKQTLTYYQYQTKPRTFIRELHWGGSTWFDWYEISFTEDLDSKQDLLVSGTNLKTINNESLLGSGNISISGGGSVIGTGSFSINNNGHLIVELPNSVDNPYFINNNGHLVYDTSNTYNGE